MKDATIILLAVLAAFALISWAAQPNAVEAVRAETQATVRPLQTQVVVQATAVEFWRTRPTPVPYTRNCAVAYLPPC